MRVEDVFGDLPTLETGRLILRKLTLDDERDVFDYASDPEVARYVTWEHHESIEDSRAFLAFVLQRYAAGEPGPWAMVLRRTGKLIGTTGFIWLNRTFLSAEIGYAMARPYWGQGLMTEATREVVRFGFETLGLNRIEACHAVENPASGRVMAKAGMTYEGTKREAAFLKGIYHDLKFYSILRREFVPSRR